MALERRFSWRIRRALELWHDGKCSLLLRFNRPLSLETVAERIFIKSRELNRQYKAGPYRGRAIIICATDERDTVPVWHRFALGGVEVHYASGKHMAMFDQERVDDVVQVVSEHLSAFDRISDVSRERVARPVMAAAS
jgi:hypothetical protein